MQFIHLNQNKPCQLLTKLFNVWEFQGLNITVFSLWVVVDSLTLADLSLLECLLPMRTSE